MSRLSKYVKEKIVKVLVAALVVGTVAGNGTLTVQAEEAATVVGEESVSGGDAVVKENVVADPEVTPEANETVNAVTVDIAGVLGAANGYGIFVEGITEQSGDSEANICTGSLKYYNNIGYTGKGTIYVDGEYTGSGSNIRCSNLILKSASFEQRGNQWFVNGVYVGTTEQIGKIERGQFDLAGAFTAIRTNAENLHAMGTELSSNEISLNDGQNIFRVNGISDFEQKTRSIAYKIFDAVELDEDELEMFEIIMNSGIFGSETVRLVNKINNIEADSLNQAKRIFITKRLFPPKKKMIADYRILEKRPYLLPGVYVYRFFKALFNSKRILNEVKTINKIDTDKEH